MKYSIEISKFYASYFESRKKVSGFSGKQSVMKMRVRVIVMI